MDERFTRTALIFGDEGMSRLRERRVAVFGVGGDDMSEVDSLSGRLNTIPYEILCGINKRIPRIYFDGENETEILQYIV